MAYLYQFFGAIASGTGDRNLALITIGAQLIQQSVSAAVIATQESRTRAIRTVLVVARALTLIAGIVSATIAIIAIGSAQNPQPVAGFAFQFSSSVALCTLVIYARSAAIHTSYLALLTHRTGNLDTTRATTNGTIDLEGTHA